MDLLRARGVPYMSRRNYVYECWHLIPWGVAAGMAEGNVSAVVVAKTFSGSDLLIALAVATPLFAKLVSLVWGLVSVGRPKLRVITLLAAVTVLCLASVGVTPRSSWGGWLFVAQMASAQVFLSGVVTIRSALWKSNYPREFRGRITARLQLIRLVPGITTMAAAAALFDRDPAAYRLVYPLAAGCGVVAIFLLQKLQIRGERAEMRRVHNNGGGDLRQGLAEPFSLVALLSPGNVIGQMVRVLRQDRRFAQYCGALMFTGCGNLMIIPVLVAILTRDLGLNYLASLCLLEVMPRVVMMVAMFRWAPYFDRVGIVRFRVVQGGVWLAFLLLGTVGTLVVVFRTGIGPSAFVLAILLYSASRIAWGMAMGGAALAWPLGHLHFAQPHEAEVYMGVHVTLTGLRGLVMPILGAWLWVHTGVFVWVLASVFSLLGLMGYAAMARAENASETEPRL